MPDNNKIYEQLFYSPQGYWKGESAINKLAEKTNTPQKDARKWLTKQALWQVYLPRPKYIPRPKFDEDRPNAVLQADLLFLPHDTIKRKHTNML